MNSINECGQAFFRGHFVLCVCSLLYKRSGLHTLIKRHVVFLVRASNAHTHRHRLSLSLSHPPLSRSRSRPPTIPSSAIVSSAIITALSDGTSDPLRSWLPCASIIPFLKSNLVSWAERISIFQFPHVNEKVSSVPIRSNETKSLVTAPCRHDACLSSAGVPPSTAAGVPISASFSAAIA